MTRTALVCALALVLPACKDAPSKLDRVVKANAMKSTAASKAKLDDCKDAPSAPVADIDSKDVLERTTVADKVFAKHVLLSYKELSDTYRGRGQDPRGAARSQAEAAQLAQDVLAKLKADPSQIDALIKEHGEDPGMKSGDAYEIDKDTGFIPEFKNLAMRLNENEAGIVKTTYGYHVIVRTPPPPPDPLETADVLQRPAPADGTEVSVKHVMIRVKGSKEEAQAKVKEVLAKAPTGKYEDLMKEYSDDPRTKDSGEAIVINTGTRVPAQLKDMALRLNMNEIGVVKSQAGYHILKRVEPPPPPPPDPLESADILARQPVTQSSEVKHILLGWADNKNPRGGDPRAAKRTRAELEKLVKDTVAKLKGGAPIEPLMKELSEDPGSAASGDGYPVTPDAGLVEPFKKLGLRLNLNEVGVVKTEFGIHIIKRTK